MKIQFRDIEHAPLPVKEKKVRQPRQPKYPMDGIAVGGARAFAVPEGKKGTSVRNTVYQAAKKYAGSNPGFAFKVRLEGSDVLVHRLDDVKAEGDGGAPAFQEAAE